MAREYSESERMLIEALVGLFVIHPNPQLKGKEEKVMKIAYEVMDKMLEKHAPVVKR
jgi:hypothetical protein